MKGQTKVDKQEYQILLDEILNLVTEERFEEAADIADRIDWRKVKRYTILQKISKLYRVNGRYDEAVEIIGYAYDKNPNNKQTVYEICDLYLEMGDLVNALQYMAVYKRMAPGDVGNAKLKYKILELEEASFEDRVEQLERIVAIIYQEEWEEWAYQLAYMYHRMGFATKCVECCNQIITRKGNGPFVIKTMELKMLHEKLSPEQQEIYDHRNSSDEEELEKYEGDEVMPGQEDTPEENLVKTIDMGKFNTINLQKALAESMRELMGEDTQELLDTGSIARSIVKPLLDDDEVEELSEGSTYSDEEIASGEAYYEENYSEENYSDGSYSEEEYYEEGSYEEDSYEEGSYEEGFYEESAEGEYEEDSYDEASTEGQYEEEGYYEESPDNKDDSVQPLEPLDETRFILPGDLARNNIDNPAMEKEAIANEEGNTPSAEKNVFFDDKTGDIIIDEVPLGMLNDLIPGVEFIPKEPIASGVAAGAATAVAAGALVAGAAAVSGVAVASATKEDPVSTGNTHRFDDVLSLDQDGQLKLVVPETKRVEKQITGQMNIEDVLYEWEKMKQDKDNKDKAEIKKNILERTGKIFADYDEEKKNSIIAQIEEEQKAQRRVLKNEIELKKLDEISSEYEEDNKDVPADGEYTEEAEGVYEEEIYEDEMAEGEYEGEYSDEYVDENYDGEIYEDEYYEDGEYSEEYDEEYDGEYTEEYEDEYPEDGEYYEATETADSDKELISEETVSEEEISEKDILEKENSDEEISEEEISEKEILEEASEENSEEAKGKTSSFSTKQMTDISSILEATADATSEKTREEMDDHYDSSEERDFSVDEQELFSDFLYSKKMRAQILESVDVISLAPYVGNIIITGDSGSGAINLAKAMIKEVQLIDGNFVASRVAKISGIKMNQKDIAGMFVQLAGGALIVEKAGKLNKNTLENITKALENASDGIIVILTDTKKEMEKLIRNYGVITGYFNARIDIVPMNNNALADYAKKYAYSKEYKIDEERAVLALYERISELQIGEHHVTTAEIEAIVNRAIANSKKPHLSTFGNILVGKRYDYDDMIILREKDFRA